MPYLQLKMFREKSFLAYLAVLGRRQDATLQSDRGGR